ncbi:TPA_asm: hypothetical protein GB513_02625 [Salmonella enterica subsp. enterica serovar Infantis]|nr:hypothetical protein [Salmonella enterica subsp. enterica serovar Infantis]
MVFNVISGLYDYFWLSARRFLPVGLFTTLLFRLKICSPCCFIHQTSKSVNVNINNSHITEGDLYS